MTFEILAELRRFGKPTRLIRPERPS
jgi:hypothetical protein